MGDATVWNILTQTSGDRSSKDGLFIGMASSTDMGNTSIWWNDHSGQFVGSWACDAGSVWTFEPVAIEDVPEMAKYADKEGNPLYPVPILWNAKELEQIYYDVMER